jgi:hypothetical protein
MVNRLALIGSLALAACSFPEQPLPPGERQIVVHAVLDPSQRYQLINLSMSDGREAEAADVNHATVTLTTPDGTELTARQDTIRDLNGKFLFSRPLYRIDLQAAGVSLVPGGKYALRVQTTVGDVITGETTIPFATPTASAQTGEFLRQRDTLRVSWSPVPGARVYEAQVWTIWSYQQQYSSTRLQYTAFRDSTLSLAGTAKDWEDNDIFPYDPYANITARVFIYAVDDNYYHYYRRLGDPFIGAAPTRLKGGVGVFGSIVPIVLRVLTVK